MHPTIKQIVSRGPSTNVTVKGWIRSIRRQKNVQFAEVVDGSSLRGIQAILSPDQATELHHGACIECTGDVVPSPARGQAMELTVHNVRVRGPCTAQGYPLQKQHLSADYLRDYLHLRNRTRTNSALLRVRDAMERALFSTFHTMSFIKVTPPILTQHDCEGGGEVFSVQSGSDFFGRDAYLTVSAQLHLESLIGGYPRVYTLGPVFRAEGSKTARHLAEFWMLEAEMAFCSSLSELQTVIHQLLTTSVQHVVDECQEELDHLGGSGIESLTKSSYASMTYTDAIKVLQTSTQTFDHDAVWGKSLSSQHERYLAEHCQGPVFVTDYPRTLKPFYMRDNQDGQTVACLDLLVPKMGELIGGSLREERHDILRCKTGAMDWYLDLRKYGTCPHGGFGMGMERLMMVVTGVDNIRDVVLFPRWHGHLSG